MGLLLSNIRRLLYNRLNTSLEPLMEVDLEQPIEEFRCVPVRIRPGSVDRLLFIYSAERFDPG